MDVRDGPLARAAAVAAWAPGAWALVCLGPLVARAGRVALPATPGPGTCERCSRAGRLGRLWTAATHPFVTQEETDAYLERIPTKSDAGLASLHAQRNRTLLLSCVALIQAAAFVGHASATGLARPLAATAPAVSNAAAWMLVAAWAMRRPDTPSSLITTLVLCAFGSAHIRILGRLPDLALDLPTFALACDVVLPALALGLLLAMPVQPGGYAVQVSTEERERVAFMTDPQRSASSLPLERESMTDNYDVAPTSPEDYTTLWSAMTYHWMGGLMNLATRRSLRPDDIWRLRSINDTSLLYSKYMRLLPPKPQGTGLLRRLVRMSAFDATLDMAWKVGGVALNYAGPALSKRILECIQEDGTSPSDEPRDPVRGARWPPRQEALAWAMCALLVALIRQVAELINFHQARQVGMRIRQVLTVELFDKTLRAKVVLAPSKSSATEPVPVSVASTGETTPAPTPAPRSGSQAASIHSVSSDESALLETTEEDEGTTSSAAGSDVGLVVNMMATDINNLLRMGCDLHNLYGAPIEILIASMFLYSLLGTAALVGIGVLAVSVPLNYATGRLLKALSLAYQQKRDRRIALEAELFRSIKYIKAQGLDSLWESRVRRARNTELWALAKCRIVNAFVSVYWAAIPLCTALLAFGLYTVALNHHLTIPVAFTAVALFDMLRGPLEVLPTFLTLFIQALVSIRRLETFLSESEVAPVPDVLVPAKTSERGKKLPPTVQIEDAVFTWPKSAHTTSETTLGDEGRPMFRLRVPELTLPGRGLCVVEGKTAAGKSALLLAILGELDQTGTLRRTPDVSYQAQATWLEGGSSVRSNILFGAPYDSQRYNAAVAASALGTDLLDNETFPQGDATRVSIQTLSGGQKARVALARALYAPNAHLILLDDCLSAVDAHIQRRIVEDALLGPLGAGSSDRLVVIATHHAHLLRAKADVVVDIDHGAVSVTYQTPIRSAPSMSTSPGEPPAVSESAAETTRPTATSTSGINSLGMSSQQTEELLYQSEKRREGVASWRALNGYLLASGYGIWMGFLLTQAFQRAFDIGEQLWVRKWGEEGPASSSPRHNDTYYLTRYGLIILAGIACVAGRYIFIYFGSQRASRSMHRSLLRAVLAATPRWHDSVPVGRLINLFSADMNVVDQDLPNSIQGSLATVVWVTGSLAVIFAFVPSFLLPIAFLATVGPSYVRGFIAAMRDMQRVQSVVASPIYTFFGQVMAGSSTIRAFGQQGRLHAEMVHLTSAFMSNWWAVCSMEVWLQIRVGAMGAISVWVVTLLCLASRSIDAGAAGIALSAASMVPQLLYALLRNYQQLTNQTNSLERVEAYGQAPAETCLAALPPPEPASNWPAFGRIEMHDVWARYDSHLPWVLKGVGFIAEPGSKIGILGRSGSGKTSTVATLLRLLPADRGTVTIDGVDVKHVPLATLRRRIAVCPQMPCLFSGDVRFNVDPFRRSTDADILHMLATLERGIFPLYETGASTGTGPVRPVHHLHLDDVVAPGGENLSAGQRQIVSLARALLSRPKVLLLDEATADTDHVTDTKVQQVLMHTLAGCTVLTVAHRLRTVINYDSVLILDKGQIVESGPPAALLRDPSSRLAQMCAALGSDEAKELHRLAGVEQANSE